MNRTKTTATGGAARTHGACVMAMAMASLLAVTASTSACGGTFYWDVPVYTPLPSQQYDPQDPGRVDDGRVTADVAPETMCALVRQGAVSHRKSDLGFGVLLAILGGAATASGTALAASASTLAPEPKQEAGWIGVWGSVAGLGLVATASALYLIVKSGQDRQEYWLANGAVAKIRADYAQYPVMMSVDLRKQYADWQAVAAEGAKARKAYEGLLLALHEARAVVPVTEPPQDPKLETAYAEWSDIKQQVENGSGFTATIDANPEKLASMPTPVRKEYERWSSTTQQVLNLTIAPPVRAYADHVVIEYRSYRPQLELANAAEAWSRAVVRGQGTPQLADDLESKLRAAYPRLLGNVPAKPLDQAYVSWKLEAQNTGVGQRSYQQFADRLTLERGWQVTVAGHAAAVDAAERAKEDAARASAVATGANSLVNLKAAAVTVAQQAFSQAVSTQVAAVAAFEKARDAARSKPSEAASATQTSAEADMVDAQAKRAVWEAIFTDDQRQQETAQREANDRAVDAQLAQTRATDAMNVLTGQQLAWTDCAAALTAIGSSDAAAAAAFQSALGSSGGGTKGSASAPSSSSGGTGH